MNISYVHGRKIKKKMQSDNHPAFLNFKSRKDQLAATASLIISSLAVM